MNFKKIHIGQIIEKRVAESGIEISRICNFFKFSEEGLFETYSKENIDTETLLKWSKFLGYDFFRLYSQHLILYAPPTSLQKPKSIHIPSFRKNIYTKEVIDFVLEQIGKEKMTKKQVMERYKIPKTTLYKWISKYKI